MNSPTLGTVLIGIVTSLLTTMVAFLVQESIRTRRQIERMLLGLSLDCVGTINAFERDIKVLDKCKSVVAEKPSDILQDFQKLRCLPSGIIVSPPLEFPKELVNLLPASDARHVFLYYDSWERFHELENRYRTTFNDLLNRIVAASADEKKRREYEVVRDELFEQLTALVVDLHSTLNELGACCCEVLLMARKHTEFTTTFNSLDEFTNGRWSSWQSVRDACAMFRCQRGFAQGADTPRSPT